MIGMSLGKTHYTNPGIHENKTFSVSVPGMDLLEKVDYCGLVSGKNDVSGIQKDTKWVHDGPFIEEERA
jgi:flavin reductase (DIM6/NTAB) family NADH-FMN oxidoreductase RutF